MPGLLREEVCHKKCAQCECSPFQPESCDAEDGKPTSAACCGIYTIHVSHGAVSLPAFKPQQAPPVSMSVIVCANSMRLQSAVRMLTRLQNVDAYTPPGVRLTPCVPGYLAGIALYKIQNTYTPLALIIPVCAIEI